MNQIHIDVMERAIIENAVKGSRAQAKAAYDALLAHRLVPEKPFGVAFAEARKAGLENFVWKGGLFHTRYAHEV
jgi:hypothetical protein